MDIVVQVADGPAEDDSVRRGGDGGHLAGFDQGEHQLLEIKGEHLGIGGQRLEGLQIRTVPCGGRGHALCPGMDKGQHGGDDGPLGVGQLKDLFLQGRHHRPFGREGKYQEIRAALAGYDELVELQGLVEYDGAMSKVVDPFVAGHAGVPLYDVDAFPEIVGLSRELVPLVKVHFKKRIHICNPNLFFNRICQPHYVHPLLCHGGRPACLIKLKTILMTCP